MVLLVCPFALNPPLLPMNDLLAGVDIDLERTIFGTEFSILYSQESRCYLVHSLNVAKRTKETLLTSDDLMRRFIVTVAIFEQDGAMVALPKICKFCAVIDNTVAF